MLNLHQVPRFNSSTSTIKYAAFRELHPPSIYFEPTSKCSAQSFLLYAAIKYAMLLGRGGAIPVYLQLRELYIGLRNIPESVRASHFRHQ